MFWIIAFLLWLAGFYVSRFNYYNCIVADNAPIDVRFGWMRHRFVAPLFCRIFSALLVISSVALLYFTETINFHWSVVVIAVIVLIFLTSFLASTSAWIVFAKTHPAGISTIIQKKTSRICLDRAGNVEVVLCLTTS